LRISPTEVAEIEAFFAKANQPGALATNFAKRAVPFESFSNRDRADRQAIR
jgi:hypothetical protein